MNRPTRITFPKRWSREKRKIVRARVMAAQWRAWYWQQVTEGLKNCLDGIWIDEMTKPFDWGSAFTVTDSEPFIDDAEFTS